MFDNDNFDDLNNQKNNYKNYKDNHQDKGKIDEFKLMHSKVHTYAGNVITEQSYKVLVDILGNPFDITRAFGVINQEISHLKSIGIDINIENILLLSKNPLNIMNCFAENESNESIVNRNQELAENFESMISQIEYELKEKTYNDLSYSCDDSYEENESSYNIINEALTMIAAIRYKMSYYLSNNNEYCTNISGIISSLEMPSDEIIDVVRKLDEMPSEEKQEYLRKNSEYLRDVLLVKEEYVKNYTSLSPHFIYLLISSLDIERANFFTDVRAKTISIDQIISSLRNYDDSLLSCITDEDSIRIKQAPEDGQTILITWDTPAILASQLVENQEKFKIKLIPIKKLLNELGGDLSCEINLNEINVYITCPEQNAPIEDIYDTIPDNLIFSHARSCAIFKPLMTPIKFAIPFELFIDKESLSNPKNREGLANLLSNISKFNSNESIETILLHRAPDDEDKFVIIVRYKSNTINGKKEASVNDEDFALFVTMSDHLSDSQVINYLYDITTKANCNYLNFSLDSLESTKDTMNAMLSAIHKARSITDDKIHIHFQNGETLGLKILDSYNNTIVSAIYHEKFKCFCGRCHKPKLTKMTLDILDKIVGYDGEKFTTSIELGEGFDFIQNLFLEATSYRIIASTNVIRMFESKICFRLALRNIPIYSQLQCNVDSTNDIKSPLEIYRMIRDEIEHGIITIKKDEFNLIGLDSPSSSKQQEVIQNNNNTIIFDAPESYDTEETDIFFKENKI